MTGDFAKLDAQDEAFRRPNIAGSTPSSVHLIHPSDQWPEPDMTIIRPDRPEAPEMSDKDLDAVFGPWAQWIRDAAEVKNAPVDFVALALLTSASAIIGNTRWAVPWEGWKEPPILWGMLVGDPSSGKSPALDAVLDPVREIDNALGAA